MKWRWWRGLFAIRVLALTPGCLWVAWLRMTGWMLGSGGVPRSTERGKAGNSRTPGALPDHLDEERSAGEPEGVAGMGLDPKQGEPTPHGVFDTPWSSVIRRMLHVLALPGLSLRARVMRSAISNPCRCMVVLAIRHGTPHALKFKASSNRYASTVQCVRPAIGRRKHLARPQHITLPAHASPRRAPVTAPPFQPIAHLSYPKDGQARSHHPWD